MARYIADTETNGLLPELTKIHSLVLKDIDHGDVFSYHDHGATDGGIEEGLARLERAHTVVGHNWIKFDAEAIPKVYPGFSTSGIIRDTIVLTRLIWADIKPRDLVNVRTKGFPGNLVGKHSLKAWGHRLGNHKGDYTGGWETWSQEMQDYCEQDIEVTFALWHKIAEQNYSEEAIQLEHDVAYIVWQQEKYGFAFNTGKAGTLYGSLVQKRDDAAAALKASFPDREIHTPFIPKASNKTRGYVKGVPFDKVTTLEFNPASRDHIAERLMTIRGWKPEVFTDSGKPKVDETTVGQLAYPEVPAIMTYLTLDKRIGQLAEGKEAWLKKVKADGRVHGGVITNGAAPGRMTHQGPNVAQVPKVGSLYGAECRELFEAGPGKVLVGIDASGVQLRFLSHFMAADDGGAYARAVVEGNQEDGTDVHSINTVALGLEPKTVYNIFGRTAKGRDCGKTFIYAFIFGCGDEKAGSIIGKGAATGKKMKASFLQSLPALANVIKNVRATIYGGQLSSGQVVNGRGYLVGLDKRRLHIRSAHGALAMLLQHCEAIMMKKALTILYASLTAAGYVHGQDYGFVANVHDEWQIECRPEIAHEIGKAGIDAITLAGQHFKLRVPLAGEYKVGGNWRETH